MALGTEVEDLRVMRIVQVREYTEELAVDVLDG